MAGCVGVGLAAWITEHAYNRRGKIGVGHELRAGFPGDFNGVAHVIAVPVGYQNEVDRL